MRGAKCSRMRKYILLSIVTLFLLVFLPYKVFAFRLVWNHSDPVSAVVGYTVHWGLTQGSYTNSREVPISSCVADPVAGSDCETTFDPVGFTLNTTYWFSATAWNYQADGVTVNRSGYATPVQYKRLPDGQTGTTPPGVPQDLGILPNRP